MVDIDFFYNQMCKVSNDIDNIIIPHIKKTKPMANFQIGVIIKMANLNLDSIYETALTVYRKLPLKERKILINNYRHIRQEMQDKVSLEYQNGEYYKKDYSKFYDRFIRYTSDILFLEKTTSFKSKLLYKNYNDDYSLLSKAYKDLNEMIFSHINKKQVLSNDQLWCIIPLIREVLITIRERAYEVYDEVPEIIKHKLYDEYAYSDECEQYIDELNKINFELRGKKVSITSDMTEDEHEYWKAERVEYLNESLNENCSDEDWYVERGIMYNDNY